MSKIIKPLDGISSKDEIENGTHISTVVRWESLIPYLEAAIRTTETEKIIGIVADEHGITVKLKHENR